MRKYQPAWIQLRDNPSHPLIISAHPSYHARIYKAIVKEKDIDLVYKVECDLAGVKSRLSRTSSGNALTIRLKVGVSLDGLF